MTIKKRPKTPSGTVPILKPNGAPAAKAPDYARVPMELWNEMCRETARYAYVRQQHHDPAAFDKAVDDGIRWEDKEARKDAALATPAIVQ